MKLRTISMFSLLAVLILILAACGSQREQPAAGIGADGAGQIAEEEVVEEEVAEDGVSAEEDAGDINTDAAEEATAPASAVTWTAWVANGMDDSLSVVDLASGEELVRVPAGVNPHILAASADGAIIYVVNAGQHDRGPDAHANEEAMEAEAGDEVTSSDPHGHGAEMEAVGEEADDHDETAEQIAHSLWAIDAASGDLLAEVPVGLGPTHPIASADGSRVYVTNTDEGSVTVIDTDTWEVVTTIPDLPEPHDGELTPDDGLLYLATAGDSTMTVVDTETFEVVKTFDVGANPRGLTVGGENGAIAYVTNKGDGTLSIIDVPNDTILATVPVGAGAHAVRVSPDDQTVYISLSQEDAVAVVDAESGEVRRTLPVGATPEQLDLSRDGRWLVVSNNGDASLSIIDLADETIVATVPVGAGAYGVQTTSVAYTGGTDAAQSSLPGLPKNTDGYVDIGVEQLAAAMQGTDFALVNVHIPYQGELPNTDLFVPFNEITANLDQLPVQDAPIVLYCRSGSMSTQAAQALVDAGYTNVYELDGGFNSWQAAGHELLMNK